MNSNNKCKTSKFLVRVGHQLYHLIKQYNRKNLKRLMIDQLDHCKNGIVVRNKVFKLWHRISRRHIVGKYKLMSLLLRLNVMGGKGKILLVEAIMLLKTRNALNLLLVVVVDTRHQVLNHSYQMKQQLTKISRNSVKQ